MLSSDTSGIPSRTQVLVIGGGPAGSYTASALARDGVDVVLLDMSKFPRYHIGESLLPSVRHFLRFIDAEAKVAGHGFAKKPGSAIKFNQYMREGYTDFVALGSSNSSWNVVRSEFDNLLLEHAAESGAQVFTQTKVESLEFLPSRTAASSSPSQPPPFSSTSAIWGRGVPRNRSDSSPSQPDGADSDAAEEMGRPVKASYVGSDGRKGDIQFDYVVDASGRNGLLSTKYLHNRKYNQSLKNVAVWGYWRGTGMYGKGTPRENAPFFEALSDESGWAWFIPLHNGLTSVGVVMEQKQLGIRSRAVSSATTEPFVPSTSSFTPSSTNQARQHATLADKYLTYLHLAPGVQSLIGDEAVLESVTDENGEAPAARSASDFSYSADSYAGEGWRVAGDAGAFIDPFFSSGVHLAMTGAISAAATIAASVRGDCEERQAAMYHNKRVAISYTRFLVVVLSAYKQIRAQTDNVLVDIDEDNFDKAFEFFRPVIQGGADMGKKLSEDEVQLALDFCVNLFSPTTPEQHEAVRRRITESHWVPDEHDEYDECHSSSVSNPVTSNDEATRGCPSSRRVTRLLDVKSPIMDPAALAKLLKSRLGLFRRTNSSGSIESVASSCSSPPPSPVQTVFSFMSGASSSSLGETTSASAEDEDDEVRMVLDKVNARRVIHAEFSGGANSLEQEAVCGMVIRLERGRLGLDRTDS
ncbi:hypothetical protein BC835DRAFT_1335198 [Cytidiella melzeri]|nr:hypothetical protein BC835DRAFT_1335198 [Cytidiella melzeri]